ncbi:MAG: TOBE domain-containing protein [Comamonadaceae bacterium]|nr:MAG: TOBE domain-containing protein [Comamonadaceae bacterium]
MGSPRDLYDFPANEFVAGFVGTMNLLQGTVQGRVDQELILDIDGVGSVRVPSHDSAPSSGHAVLSFRPHALQIGTTTAPDDTRRAWLQGVVESSEFLGEATRYQVRVGTQSLTVDQPHCMGVSRYAAGSAVGIGLEQEQTRLLPV